MSNYDRSNSLKRHLKSIVLMVVLLISFGNMAAQGGDLTHFRPGKLNLVLGTEIAFAGATFFPPGTDEKVVLYRSWQVDPYLGLFLSPKWLIAAKATRANFWTPNFNIDIRGLGGYARFYPMESKRKSIIDSTATKGFSGFLARKSSEGGRRFFAQRIFPFAEAGFLFTNAISYRDTILQRPDLSQPMVYVAPGAVVRLVGPLSFQVAIPLAFKLTYSDLPFIRPSMRFGIELLIPTSKRKKQ